jgi:hypothetical protein
LHARDPAVAAPADRRLHVVAGRIAEGEFKPSEC